MESDYCAYPPQLADDVEITEQRDGDRLAFIAGSAAVGRYILLREAERRVLSLLEKSLTPAAICEEFTRRHSGKLPPATLAKFLTRLDEVGILAGERAEGVQPPEQRLGAQFYTRFKIFNPDPLFTRLVTRLRWIWTTQFFVCSLLLMMATAALALMNADEVISYVFYTLREHYLAIVIAGLLIGVTHEFAHGLTCKAFGGRANEVGGLLIYYFLPALYCNVSGIHLISERGRRLWVIAAGVYWQLIVGTVALLAWFALTPYTLLADVAFAFFCGSVLDVAFNGNPLIKLDGYYFLSQWLRLPNLMDRSRAYWRGLLRWIVFGERNEDAARFSRRERAIFTAFGLASFCYTTALMVFILFFVGGYLIDWFHLAGLLGAVGIALFYARRPTRQLIAATGSGLARMTANVKHFFTHRMEGKMANNDQTAMATIAKESNGAENERQAQSHEHKPSRWRRRLVPLTIALIVAAVLCLPWKASVGAYGSLIAIPEREAIIRAPESATLIELAVGPGDSAASGAVVGRMGSLELEEQLVEAQSELARANADYDRLLGELRAQGESVARNELLLRRRRQDYDEISSEQRQIEERHRAESNAAKYLLASTWQEGTPTPQTAAQYPAALAVLQSDVDLRHARLDEARLQLDRARKLHTQGVVARSEFDAAETRAATLAIELAAARDRFEAALVEHRRKRNSVATEMQVARSDAGAAALQVEKLSGELRSMRGLIRALEDRRDLLLRKRAQFELVTPRAGSVFGEDLSRSVGRRFQQGVEICRVADTRQLVVRIQVSEREIGDVRVGHSARLKVRAYPDHTFRGEVSKIGGESEVDQNQQATYRVELMIENSDGSLRPGMTAYARIEFGRQMVGRILLHKIRQALRPELWML
jgi:putative peptide zinc metalloprotease protein